MVFGDESQILQRCAYKLTISTPHGVDECLYQMRKETGSQDVTPPIPAPCRIIGKLRQQFPQVRHPADRHAWGIGRAADKQSPLRQSLVQVHVVIASTKHA